MKLVLAVFPNQILLMKDFFRISLIKFIAIFCGILFSHPPKRRRVTYASTIRPASASASASASTLSTSSMKPLHGIISYCTCILG